MLKCFAVLCLVALSVNAFEFNTNNGRSNRMNQLSKAVGARMLAGTVTPGQMGMMDSQPTNTNQFVPTPRSTDPNIMNMQSTQNTQQLTPDQMVQLRQFMSSPNFQSQQQNTQQPQQQNTQQQQQMMPPTQQPQMMQTPPQQQQQPMMQQTQQPMMQNNQQFRIDSNNGMMNPTGMNPTMPQQQPMMAQQDQFGRMMPASQFPSSTVSTTTMSTTTPKPSPAEQQLLDQQVRMQNQIQNTQFNMNNARMPQMPVQNTAVPSMPVNQMMNTQMPTQMPVQQQMMQQQMPVQTQMNQMPVQQPVMMQPGQLHPSQIQAQQQIAQTVQQQQIAQQQQKAAQEQMMQGKINNQQVNNNQFFNQQQQLAQQQQSTQQRISAQQQMSMPSTKLPGQQQPQFPANMPMMMTNNTLGQPIPQQQPMQPVKQQIPVSEAVCANVQQGDLVPHPQDPTQFVICYGFGEFTVMDCPDHTVYNAHMKRCDITTELPMLCKSNPCQNNAKCTEVSPIEFKCECPSGFGGIFCEKLDTCSTRPCGQEGVCLSFALGSPVPHVCLCNGGRSVGLSCDRAEPNPCLAAGASFKMLPVQFNTGVFAHCEGARPHFKFCQPPLVFSAAKGTCEWSA